MRCWLFHAWGKWKRYKEVREIPILEITAIPGDFTTATGTFNGQRKIYTDRQERECQRCGYIQDRAVGPA